MDAIVAKPANSHEAIDVRKVFAPLAFVVNVRSWGAADFAVWVLGEIISTD